MKRTHSQSFVASFSFIQPYEIRDSTKPFASEQYSIKSLAELMYPDGITRDDEESPIEETPSVSLTDEEAFLAEALETALSSDSTKDLQTRFKDLTLLSSDKLNLVLAQITSNKPSISDETFSVFCASFLSVDFGHSESTAFFSTIFLSHVQRLEQPPSRLLLNSLQSCGKKYPKALKNSLLIPLLVGTIGSPHVELMNSLLFECLSTENQASFFTELLSGPLLAWNEQTVVVIQNIITQQTFVLTPQMMEGLVRQFEGGVKNFPKNLKFCTLLFQLISKFPTLVAPHSFALQQVLNQTDTFMTKKALNKLSS